MSLLTEIRDELVDQRKNKSKEKYFEGKIMLAKKIIRLCAVLVLSGVSSVALSQTFTFSNVAPLITK